jgi:hypothetical protein
VDDGTATLENRSRLVARAKVLSASCISTDAGEGRTTVFSAASSGMPSSRK